MSSQMHQRNHKNSELIAETHVRLMFMAAFVHRVFVDLQNVRQHFGASQTKEEPSLNPLSDRNRIPGYPFSILGKIKMKEPSQNLYPSVESSGSTNLKS